VPGTRPVRVAVVIGALTFATTAWPPAGCTGVAVAV
jgi:hypothetical protein